MLILAACLLSGLAVVAVAQVVGWGDSDEGLFYLFIASLYFPFTGAVYLALFGLIGWRARRPRLWAYVLLPIFWGVVPIFAVLIVSPTIVALWVALIVFARLVETPTRHEPAPSPGADRYAGAPWGPS